MNGNLGIGSANPTARLEVRGTDNSSNTLAFRVQDSGATERFRIYNAGNTDLVVDASNNGGGIIHWAANDSAGWLALRPPDNSVGLDLSREWNGSIHYWWINLTENAPFFIGINDIPVFAISTANNVGIGSTTPRAKLDVEGSVYVGNGNIGVASSAPGQKIDVTGTVRATAFIGDASGLTGIAGWTRSGANVYVTTSTDNVGIGSSVPRLKLEVQGGGYFSGNVGIGSSAPLRPLDVAGVAYFNGNVGIGSTAPRASLDIVSSNLSAISYFGTNVGIGSTAPGQMLDVTGVIRQSNCKGAALSSNAAGDIICTSDERLKTIYGFYPGGLATLSAIRPIRFSFKNESLVHIGFSAQNVKSVLPEASALQDSGYWSLDSTAIIALTVNAIKEQQTQIITLAEKLSSFSVAAEVDRATVQALRIENGQVKERLKKLMAVVCRERADEPACR